MNVLKSPVPRLDLFTLNVVSVAVTLVTGIALLLVSILNRRVEGIRRCGLSCFLISAGVSLFPLRLVVPGSFVILVPNLLLFGAGLVLLDGIRSFRGLDRPRYLFSGTSIVYLSFYGYWLFIHDDFNARVAIQSFCGAVPALLAAATMARDVPRRDRAVYWGTAAAFGLHGIAMLVRAVDAFGGHARAGFFEARNIDILNAATLNLSAIACAFGLSIAMNLKLQRETEKLAHYDTLTNLPNRRFFEERLERAERRAFETGQRIAVVYCDVDNFKGINDSLGHEGGDKALQLVSDCMRSAVSENISLARVGGDEFLLLIENAESRESIHLLIERLHKSMAGFVEFGGRSAALSVSCGVAIYPDDVGSVSDLIRLADAAMYTTKQRGRFHPFNGAALA